MFAFILGCLYLINALLYLWLINGSFNLIGFIYNQENKKFLLLYDMLFIALAFLSMLEQAHWIFLLLFLMHALNSAILLLKPSFFYQSKKEIQNLDETTLINYMALMTIVAGVACIFVSYL